MTTENLNSFGHIGVLMGGCSSEREISLKSGKAVFAALEDSKCHASALDITSHDEKAIMACLKEAKIDVAFIALHGQLGEDGVIQSILEKMNIPYTGSGVEASRLALNKVLAQEMFKNKNIPIPAFQVFSKGHTSKETLGEIQSFPVVVKPASQGSSIGITLVEDRGALGPAIEQAFQYDEKVLVEQYIEGKELTVGILDQRALPVIEIRPKNKFFDFTAKYQSGMTEYIIPAEISKEAAKAVQDVAYRAHDVLGCSDMSRVDVMLDKNNRPFVLEINTIPGFTATSLLPKAAKAAGLEFRELCQELIRLAYRKAKRPQTSVA